MWWLVTVAVSAICRSEVTVKAGDQGGCWRVCQARCRARSAVAITPCTGPRYWRRRAGWGGRAGR